MQTLTQQYYNAVTTGLNLSPQLFQLTQGNIALGATSQALWGIMDSIPPLSLTQAWNPAGYNSFASNYGSVLSRIQSASSGAWDTALGDYASAWQTYVKATPPPTDVKAAAAYVRTWATSAGMTPQQVSQVTTLYLGAMNDPIVAANVNWAVAGGQGALMAYTTSISTAENQIGMAPAGSVELNSETTSSDASHTWANGSVDGSFDIFFGGGSASYDASSSVMTDAGVSLSIKFTHVATIPVAPLSSGTMQAGPTTYQPWYVSAALQTAYNNNNFTTWPSGSPDWNSFFSPTGSMRRATAALIVVDGIQISVSSNNSIAQASQQQFKTAFEAGFFPFFGVSGSGGWSNSSAYDDQGRIQATSTCATGNPQILGVLVSDIGSLIASDAVAEARRAQRALYAPAVRAVPAYANAVAIANAAQVVTVAWSAVALQGVRNLHVQPGIEQLITGAVSAWATNNAPHWALNVPQQYASPVPHYTATARVTAINGGNRSVTITNFV
jgi:hypothetical protein